MDEVTLEALNSSISKYENRVKILKENLGKEVSLDEIECGLGIYNCPLCMLFLNGYFKDTCIYCPIREKIGLTGCENTPYDKLICYFPDNKTIRTITEEIIKAFEDELNFLKSLLTEE